MAQLLACQAGWTRLAPLRALLATVPSIAHRQSLTTPPPIPCLCLRVVFSQAVDIASEELDKGSKTNPSLKDIAMVIKRKFDDKYNPSWHCIVGRTFGSYVTFEHL